MSTCYDIDHDAEYRKAALAQLLAATQALGVMPEGYCFCSKDRIGDDSKTHEPKCRDLRLAIAKAEDANA